MKHIWVVCLKKKKLEYSKEEREEFIEFLLFFKGFNKEQITAAINYFQGKHNIVKPKINDSFLILIEPLIIERDKFDFEIYNK